MFSCVAAIPLVIHKKRADQYTATVTIRADAKDIYNTALLIVEESSDIELLKKNDENLAVEARKGKQFASVVIKQLYRGRTLLTVITDSGEGYDMDEELALRVTKRICDKLGVEYRVVIDDSDLL
jgi:regulation of enolase protein 1 (concanavalin A-like superfamily)